MPNDAAAHPVWSSDNEAVKEEFRRLEARAKRWEDAHGRAEGDAECFQIALEEIAKLPSSRLDEAAVLAASALERRGI